MVKNGSRRATCTNASECVHFSRSRFSFAHIMDAKIAQNRTRYDRARREPGQFELYCTIYKNKMVPEARILSPFRTRPNASTDREPSFFDPF